MGWDYDNCECGAWREKDCSCSLPRMYVKKDNAYWDKKYAKSNAKKKRKKKAQSKLVKKKKAVKPGLRASMTKNAEAIKELKKLVKSLQRQIKKLEKAK